MRLPQRKLISPANSSDLSLLHLGCFSIILSLQNETNATNIEGLISAVVVAFQETSSVTLVRVWLFLRRCLEKAMTCKGEIEYHMPHGDKEKTSSHLYQSPQAMECTA